ncbi:hypothetical protein A9Q99_24020 [Gammaproteobacteria bacterium 45_16_T64]|nr:hypothetical protein A9Q99_24020 [Gammaproteobacteria bacterium 45_16_T64]
MNIEDIPKMIRHLGRTLFGKAPMAPKVALDGKHIIVTGASPGSIGFETAKTLASWGACVTITTRSNPEATVDAITTALSLEGKPADLHGHSLDLTQAASVCAFSEWYLDTFNDKLDVLINNAGIHLDLLSQWDQPNLTADGFEIHWRTNYLGTSMLTQLLLPALTVAGKQYGDARVVNVSSHLHSRGINREFFSPQRPYDSWSAYGQSKLAVVHHAFELQRRYASDCNLQGYVLHPGAIATNISGKGLEGNGLLQKLRNLFSPIEALILMSPNEGAQTQILCATAPSVEGGKFYERCETAKVNPEANDKTIAKRLWDETQVWALTMSKAHTQTSTQTSAPVNSV